MRWILPFLLCCSIAAADPIIVQTAGPDATGTANQIDPALVPLMLAQGKEGTYSLLIVIPDGGKVVIRQCTLVIGGPAPTPVPTPQPPSPPKPDVPVTPTVPPATPIKYGLDKVMSEAVLTVPEAARGKAKVLALGYAATIIEIDEKRITTPEKLAEAQKATNRLMLGDDAEAWSPWAKIYAAKLKELSESGQMVTMEDHRQAWYEIAKGLNGK